MCAMCGVRRVIGDACFSRVFATFVKTYTKFSSQRSFRNQVQEATISFKVQSETEFLLAPEVMIED